MEAEEETPAVSTSTETSMEPPHVKAVSFGGAVEFDETITEINEPKTISFAELRARLTELDESVNAVESVQMETNDFIQNEIRYKATRKDMAGRYFVFILAGMSFLMPYHCFSLSTPYVVSNLLTNSTTDCAIDVPYLRETWPTLFIWIWQLTGFGTMVLVQKYESLKQKVIQLTRDSDDVYQRGRMFKAVLCGTGEVLLLIICTAVFTKIRVFCSPVILIIVIFGLVCVLAVAANIVQISLVAIAAMYGKCNINAFTIGMDLGGVCVATTSFVYALTTQSQDVLAYYIQSILLVALFVISAVCFTRSKDYCVKLIQHKTMVTAEERKTTGDNCNLNTYLFIQFLLFWQTFTVFPGVFLSVVPYDESKLVWWYSLSVFVNFSVWALLFSIASNFLYKKIFLNENNRTLFTVSLSCAILFRMVLITFLYLGTNYKPNKPRPALLSDPFVGDWAFAFLVSLFAISHSCIASLTDIAIGYECLKKMTDIQRQGGKLVLLRNAAICFGLLSNMVLNKIY